MTDAIILDRAHSPLGPSSFERIEACPASAVLGSEIGGSPSSVFADEGSAAHMLFELCMTTGDDPWEYLGREIPFGLVTLAIDDEVVDHLTVAVTDARAFVAGRPFECEVRLSVPGTLVFGTSDLFAGGILPVKVGDLKYGAGVQVYADTVQLALYGLMGLLRDFPESVVYEGDPDDVVVETAIFQPRGAGATARYHNWKRHEMASLLGRVKAAVARYATRNLDYKTGDHCRWCAAIAVCPKLAQQAKDAALSFIVTDPHLPINAETLDNAMVLMPALELYINKVTKLAFDYLEAGGVLASTKLVAKRGIRKWDDPDETAKWLRANGMDPFLPGALKSPRQAEDSAPRALKEQIKSRATSTSSGNTLAPMSDPRPAVDMRVTRVQAALAQTSARALLSRAKPKPETKES